MRRCRLSPEELRPIRVPNPCRHVAVSGKVPPQAVTSRHVGRVERSGIRLRNPGSGERPEARRAAGGHADGQGVVRAAGGAAEERRDERDIGATQVVRCSVRPERVGAALSGGIRADRMLAAVVCANIVRIPADG